MKIFLIGFMGSGKTSLGRQIAARLGWRFVDMDKEIERSCGMKVSEVFATHGEDHFRECERDMLQAVCNEEDNTVVSTGGGAPCHGDNIQTMNQMGRTVYLRMSPDKLVARLEHGRDKRPKIQGMDDEELLSYICDTLPGREEYYGKAHLIIDCDGASDQYICEHISRFAAECRSDETNR